MLYLEFMYLVPQLNSFYTPCGAAAPPSNRSAASEAPPRPYYVRLPDDHAACALLRQAGVTELQTHRQSRRPTANAESEAAPLVDVQTAVDASSRVVVFKLSSAADRAAIGPFMPSHWDNAIASSSTAAGHPPPHAAVAAAERQAAAEYRARVQRLFFANALVPEGSAEWKRCLARGRFELRGIHNVLHVRKYRALHKRYGWASQLSRIELEAALGGSVEEVEQALLGLSNKDVYGYAGEGSS